MSTARPTGNPALTYGYVPSYYPPIQKQYFYANGKFYTTNTCLANAITSGTSCQVYHELKATSDPWREYLNFSVSWIWGTPNIGADDSFGMMYDNTFNAMKTYGVPVVETMTFTDNEKTDQEYPDTFYHSPKTIDGQYFRGAAAIRSANYSKCLQYATPQKISSWSKFEVKPYVKFEKVPETGSDGFIELVWRISDVYCEYDIYNLQQAVMDSTKSVYMAIEIDGDFDNVSSNGIIPNRTTGKTNRGGHAMLVTGWKWINRELYWEVQNSWGVGWGDYGKGYVHSSWMNVEQVGNSTSSNWHGGIYDFYVTRSNATNTRPELPFKTPNPARLVSRMAKSMNVETDVFNGAIQYRFWYRVDGESWFAQKTSTNPYALLSPLNPGTRYELWVTAIDSQGTETKKSQSTYATTLPNNMISMTLNSKNNTSVTLSIKGNSSGAYGQTYITYDRVIDVYTVENGTDVYLKTVVIQGGGSTTSFESVVVSGLSSSKTYKFLFKGRLNVSGTYLYSETPITLVVGSQFEWDTPKTTSVTFNTTYDSNIKKWKASMIGVGEWKRLCDYINSKRTVNYNFTTPIQGNIFSSAMFNQAISAIQGAGGTGLPLPKSIGDDISCSDLNKLKNSINKV